MVAQGPGFELAVGAPKNLAAEGCGFVPSLMQGIGEYDLAAVQAGQLFFGDRSGDLSKSRPAALYPFPLVQK